MKQEIMRDRAYRIKLLAREKYMEEQQLKEAEQKISLQNVEIDTKVIEEQKLKEAEHKKTSLQNTGVKVYDYKQEFRDAYKQNLNMDKILPVNYVEEMMEIILDDFPQDIIEKMTQVYKSGTRMPDELVEAVIKGGTLKNRQRGGKLQRALETAIANELCAKGANPMLYGRQTDSLIITYRNKMHENLPKKQYPDANRIQRLYNEYKKDLTEEEIWNIIDNYFIVKTKENKNPQNILMLINYIKSYGRGILILFSNKSAFPDEVKMQFNDKFLKLMPEQIKDFCIPVFSSSEDIIEEKQIQKVRLLISKRFDFMPEDFLNAYTQELANTIRLYKRSDYSNKSDYSVDNFKKIMCQKPKNIEDGVSFIRIPKFISSKVNTIKIISGEQALADELFRVTGNEKVYGLELEDLCNAFEMFSSMKTNNMEIYDEANNFNLKAKMKPNKNRIFTKYREYVKDLNDRADDIFSENQITDEEELLYALNPVTGNNVRDEYIRQRIKLYIA